MLSARAPGPEATRAMEELCERYWPALRTIAIRLGCSEPDADDMAQGFFVQVVKKDLFSKADPNRGKLRTFLITAFRRHLQDQWSKASAQKRGGDVEVLSFDEERDGLASGSIDAFDREWAARVMDLSLERLQERYQQEEKEEVFHVLRPHLTGDLPDGGMNELAEKLDLSTGATKVALHRIRKRFGETLRQEVAETLGENEDVEEELRHLFAAVS